jgi:ribosomal protein S13
MESEFNFKRILNQLNIDPETKVSDLNETNVSALRDILKRMNLN